MEYREDLMAKAPSVRKNYIYNLIYQVMTLITPFITTPYISRVLGADITALKDMISIFAMFTKPVAYS